MIATRLATSVFIVLLLTGLAAGPTTQPTSQPAESKPLSPKEAAAAAQLAAEFTDRLVRLRYMEQGKGMPVAVPGWEGFPTQQYTYTVVDRDGTRKQADVVMLNPTATQIARWIVSGLIETRGEYDPEAGRAAFRTILSQSGGQFPVSGVVYEDILPADGKKEIYCFRDGVTVAVEGVPHRSTEPMTEAQRKASLAGPVTRVYRFARIQSTSPEMWIAAGGSKEVLGPDGKPSHEWMLMIRDAYQKAWTSDRNALLVAWLKSRN